MRLPTTLRWALVVWVGGLSGLWGQEAGEVVKPAEVEQTTQSLSGQFTVHGAEFRLRSAVADLAEKTKSALELEVGEAEGEKHSIVIELHGADGKERKRSLVPGFYVMKDGFRLQLDVYNVERGLDHDELERSVLELLLHERCLRGADPATFEDMLKLPWWLKEGLLESFRWRQKEADKELYQALFKNKGGFTVDRVFAAENVEAMGAGERSAFRASAGTLILALLRQEGGKEGMAGMLAEASTFRGQPEALLKQHFPGLNIGQNSLQKWWALQLADLAKLSVTETLDILASEKELARVLLVRHEDAQFGLMEFGPDQFRDILALPAEMRRDVLAPMLDNLNLLSYRIFPGYRPIIVGYVTVVADLAKGQDAEIEMRLARLDERRVEMVELGKRTRDFMEWYRINTAEDLSGAFDDYLELKEELDRERSEQRGPLAEYLKGMQEVYERD